MFSCWASPLYYCWLALLHEWCPFIMAIGLYPGEVVRHGQQVPAHFLVLLRPYRPVVYTYLMSAWVMPWAGYLSQVWRNFLRGWLVIVCLANWTMFIAYFLCPAVCPDYLFTFFSPLFILGCFSWCFYFILYSILFVGCPEQQTRCSLRKRLTLAAQCYVVLTLWRTTVTVREHQ